MKQGSLYYTFTVYFKKMSFSINFSQKWPNISAKIDKIDVLKYKRIFKQSYSMKNLMYGRRYFNFSNNYLMEIIQKTTK